MNDRAWIATRKGLFEMRRRGPGAWRIERTSFLGEPVTMVLPPDDNGFMLAALNLGHFGVKVHASDDAGATWREVATPAYPRQPPAGSSAASSAEAGATSAGTQATPDGARATSAGAQATSGTQATPVDAPTPAGTHAMPADAQAPATEAQAAPEAQPPSSAPDIPWKLVQIWSLAAANGSIWAGTLPGGLFRSTDRGASWQLVESLWTRPERAEWFGGGYDVPGIHSLCPHPARAGELLVGVSCGGAWFTDDGGASWSLRARGMRAGYMPPEGVDNQNVQDPHLIVRCAGAPDHLWCQHHSGIWRSSDDGASWQEVTGVPVSNFGFAVAVHPGDPQTAWFAPATADERRVPRDGALVVNRTRDGGTSFETLREGLPQSDCYDLVYRHGLAVADDGRTLLMGSTTGGVWASGDAGERWSALSARLPPIYAVRFG